MSHDLHPFLARLAAAGAYEPPSRPQRAQNGAGRVAPLPGPGDPQAARYAGVALSKEAELVAGAPEGTRNDTLNKAAFRVGQLVACGWLADQAATDTLIDAGMAAGLSFAESERTVNSGLDAGRQTPRAGVELHPPTPPAAYVVPDDAGTGGVALGGAQVSGGSHDVASGEPTTAQRPRQLVDGGAYIHGARPDVPALWGDGDDVLWAKGEPTIITGPTGTGKTTLGTCVIAGRLGLLPEVLGYPVKPGSRKTLVLAMDRPAQIQRAMARLLRQWPEDVLNERLVVWQGPPPMDLGRHPLMLYQLAELADADTVVIDSLKDAALKLSDEETGQGLSRAMNYCVSNGVEVLAYHHQTKRSGNATGKPNTLADVYGSSWITAGAGSVILLWGSAGDLVVELSHLKQPAGDVGPLHIGHDHTAGRTFLYEGMGDRESLLDLLASGPQTASTVASWLHGDDASNPSTVAKMRRRLDKLVDLGHAVRTDPAPGRRDPGGRLGGREAARYALAHRTTPPKVTEERLILELGVSAGRTEKHGNSGVDLGTESARPKHTEDTPSTNPQVAPKINRSTPPNAPPKNAPKPPFRGGVGGVRAYAREGEIPISLESHDVEVCARCHQDAERLVPAPGGRRWCPECADPTEAFERKDK